MISWQVTLGRDGLVSGPLVVTVAEIDGLSLVGVGGLGYMVTGSGKYGPHVS